MQFSATRLIIIVVLGFFVCSVGAMLWKFTGFWWVGIWGAPFVIIASKYIENMIAEAGEKGVAALKNQEFTREDRPLAFSFLGMIVGILLTVYLAFGYRNMSPDTIRLKKSYTLTVLRAPKIPALQRWLQRYADSQTGLDHALKSELLPILAEEPDTVRAALRRTELEIRSGSEVVKIDALRWLYSRLIEEEVRGRVSTNFLARILFYFEGHRISPDIPFDEKYAKSAHALISRVLCDPELTEAEFRELALNYWPASSASLLPVVEKNPQLYDFTAAAANIILFGQKSGADGCAYSRLSDEVKAEWAQLIKADQSKYAPKIHYHIREFRANMMKALTDDGFLR